MVFLSRLLRADVCKQSLLSLRKSTGHSFQHCKKALEQSNNNINEAVKWLETESLKQGWTKLERSAARATKEGVFGIAAIDNVVAVTEVNCETDFVAKNAELRSFAAKTSQGLCEEFSKKGLTGLKLVPWEELCEMILDTQSISEGRARLVAKVGENLNLRQSMVAAAPDGEKVAVSCHPDGLYGRYGAVVFYKGGDPDLAEKMCRHIVGMRPAAIGNEEDLVKAKKAKDKVKAEAAAAKATTEGETKDSPSEICTEEAAENEEVAEELHEELLILQDFVFDQDKKVADILRENNMEVTRFWRFECGEELVESRAQS